MLRATRLTRGLGLVTRTRCASVRFYSESSSSFDSNESQSGSRGERPQANPENIVHFGGLPVTATREKLMETLASAGLTGVSRVHVPISTLTQGSRGFAFVTFDSAENANQARNASVSFEGTPLKISKSRSREESLKLKIYVGDLDYNTTDSQLKSAIEEAFGAVEYASVAVHRGISKGFGFATFKSTEDADKARAVGRLMIDGKPARIESVRERESIRGTPRDGGYGSDRSSGYGSERRGGYGSSDRSSGYGSGDRSSGYGSERRGGYGSGDRSSGYGSERRGGYGSSDRSSGYGSSDRSSGYGSSRGYSSRGGEDSGRDSGY